MSTLPASFTSPSSRRSAVAGVLLVLAGVAWLAANDRMSGVAMAGHFTAGSLGFFVGLWVVMMAAMMFPSVWPAVAMFGLIVRRRSRSGTGAFGRSTAFVVGYLIAWTAFGIAAFALLALARNTGLDGLATADLARYVVAPVALLAAVYQVVPFKQTCLRGCRGPLSFFLHHWREGRAGAIRMGLRHGAFCVGCCWMLMVVLLAVGVMSISWMAVVSLAIAVEKLAPPRLSRVASGSLAAGLVLLAVLALIEPAWLPGLGGMGGMGGMNPMNHGG